jgi:MFS transporter, AAHS family, 4-hydroxybenzoate transporter
VLQVGGLAPLACAALLWLLLPESPRFLVQNPRNWPALERLLQRMGRPVAPESAFEDAGERRVPDRAPIRALLGPNHVRDTTAMAPPSTA